MNCHVIHVHWSSEKYFYMIFQSLSLFIIDFFSSRVAASVCGQQLHPFVENFILLALQKRRFFFHEFFTVPKNGNFSKSFEINNNAKIMQDN